MLHEIRAHASGFFTKILMVFLIGCFAFWGISDVYNSSSTPKNIAHVGNQDIPIDDFKAEMEILKRSFGEHFSEDLARSLNLYKIKLEELINRALVNQKTRSLGLSVSDATIARSIAKDSNFHNATGDFDKGLFRLALRENAISEMEYFNRSRLNTGMEVMIKTFEIHPAVPTNLAQQLYAIQNAQKKVTLVAIDKASANSTIVPNDVLIEKFYQEHKSQYIAPEYRDVTYIEILPEAITQKIVIKREEAFDLYQQRIKEYVLPQKRQVDQLLYTTKAEAENAYNLLRKGESFENVISKVIPKNKDAVDLGARFKTQLTTGAEEVFSLQRGGFTAPIESAFGWHIFRVREIEEEHTASFESVQASIEEELRQAKANDKLSETIERLEDALSGGGSIEAAAKVVELPLSHLTAVDASGKDTSGNNVLDSVKHKDMLAKIFTLEAKKRSSVISVNDGRHFVVYVNAMIPSREKALAEVKDQVRDDMIAADKQNSVKNFADTVALNAGTLTSAAFQTFLSNNGVSDVTTTVVTRNGFAPTNKELPARFKEALPSMLLDKLFTLKNIGEATPAYPYGNGYLVARLEENLPAPDVKTAEGVKLFDALKSSLAEEHSNEVMNEFTRNLRQQYPVEIDEQVYHAIADTGKTEDIIEKFMSTAPKKNDPQAPKDKP